MKTNYHSLPYLSTCVAVIGLHCWRRRTGIYCISLQWMTSCLFISSGAHDNNLETQFYHPSCTVWYSRYICSSVYIGAWFIQALGWGRRLTGVHRCAQQHKKGGVAWGRKTYCVVHRNAIDNAFINFQSAANYEVVSTSTSLTSLPYFIGLNMACP